MSSSEIQNDTVRAPETKAIRLDIPSRWYVVPGTAFFAGSIIGLVRGGRNSSMQFLAENVHRPPTTVQGWYFYNKTKNYKVMLGGLRGAGADGSRLGILGLGWVILEETLERVGWTETKEIGAAIGTACMFSALYRLSWKGTRQTVIVGVMVGGAVKGLGIARGRLEEWRKKVEPPME
ncbi:hypothetical protein M378DRAFT_72193 [Amanita muscaria Koide BX008]|uniref:Uncharacterized protein n=1 Tax=Amanita muscaria (strain Koide BX008) TaxID=946122 RepID=A0A0C2SXU5_AMAMK|nr:hypothetical protein M378DRAFT_72193 [Amanita muscaria Koide BX008]